MSTNMPDFKTDPDVVAVVSAAVSLRTFASGLVVKNDAQYQSAGLQLTSIKGELAKLERARKKITVPMNAALDAVNAQAKEAAAPLLADEITIKRALIRYSDEQDQLRQEAQRRANEIADKERRRLQAIADETARKAREEADKKRREAETAAAAGRQAEADRLNAQAARVEERAEAKTDLFENRAAQVVAPIAQQAAPKVGGITVPEVWDFEITDEAAVPRAYCDVSTKRIRSQVQATKGMTQIPGVRVFKTKRIAAGVA